MLDRLQVIIDKQVHKELGTTVRIRVDHDGTSNLVQRIVPDNDFESHFDYVWDACKNILDEELKTWACEKNRPLE